MDMKAVTHNVYQIGDQIGERLAKLLHDLNIECNFDTNDGKLIVFKIDDRVAATVSHLTLLQTLVNFYTKADTIADFTRKLKGWLMRLCKMTWCDHQFIDDEGHLVCTVLQSNNRLIDCEYNNVDHATACCKNF